MELGPLAQDAITRSFATVFLTAMVYFLPSLLARYRSHHNAMAIITLNLLLGWTVVGWIGALIWSLTSPPKR